MKITKEMIDRKKFDVPRPNEFREHLAKACFPNGMEKYGLDHDSMDEIAYFYADMRIHAMNADCIEHFRGEYPCLTESRYPWPEKGLFIFGPSGTGKTTIAEVLAETFRGSTLSMQEVYEKHNVDTPYIRKNYKTVLLEMEADGLISVSDPENKTRRKGTLADRLLITFLSNEGKPNG